jgi:hypothetical protein
MMMRSVLRRALPSAMFTRMSHRSNRSLMLTAVASVLGACSGSSPAAPVQFGSIRVTATTTGADIDTAGYLIYVSGGLPTGYRVSANGNRLVPDLTTIVHWVIIRGLDHNCHAVGVDSVDVEVQPQATAATSFAVNCVIPAPVQHKILYSGLGLDSSVRNIFVMDTDGTNPVQLTTDGGARPRISPDGRQILYKRYFPVTPASAPFAVQQIYWMRGDGSGHRSFGPPCRDSRDATWSRDGTRIAFVCDTSAVRDPRIWVMNADGTGAVMVSPNVDPYQFGTVSPTWSPDGSRIAFSSGNRLWVVSSSGGAATPVTSTSSDAWIVDWSPIGDTLVYENYNTGAQDGLYLINVNGTGRRFFASTPDFSSGPVWSFDGHEAVFFGDHNIYVIHADGTQQQVRSSNDGYDPAWSP